MSAAAANVASLAESYGFQRIVDFITHQVRWRIRCDSCGKNETYNWGPVVSPGIMVRNMRKAGWIVGKNTKAVCPECQRKNADAAKAIKAPKAIKAAKPKKDADVISLFKTAVEPLPELVKLHDEIASVVEAPKYEEPKAEAPVVNSEIDAKVTRKLFRLLDSVFDDRIHAYEDGWSDEMVAKNVGVSLDHVVKVRMEAYGVIGDDPAVKALADDITLTKMILDEGVDKIKGDIAKLSTEMQQALDVLTARMNTLLGGE